MEIRIKGKGYPCEISKCGTMSENRVKAILVRAKAQMRNHMGNQSKDHFVYRVLKTSLTLPMLWSILRAVGHVYLDFE